MKKYNIYISLLLLVLMISGCAIKSDEAYIAKQLSIDIPDVLNIEYMDDHRGFHGDGEKFAEIEFDNPNGLHVLSQIQKSGSWNKMPLTENLNLIMYGGIRDSIEYTYNFADKLGIPKINNGYWYFIDRHSESMNPEKDVELFDRHSLNFTLSMFDAEDNTLYYFEFDT